MCVYVGMEYWPAHSFNKKSFLKIMKNHGQNISGKFILHSPVIDNNLVSIRSWRREIVVKLEKVYNYLLHSCVQIFFLGFTALKMRGNSKNGHFLVKKVEYLRRYCPATLGTAFDTKFQLNPKVQNSGF